MRKGFKFIDPADVVTPVIDGVSRFVPDMSLSLREIMDQFAYMGADRISEIINRGYIGDEDDDNDGTDPRTLDFAELHDRLFDKLSRVDVVLPADEPAEEPADEPAEEPAEEQPE